MRTERKQRLAATLLGAGGAFPLAFALSMLWGGCPAIVPTPGPTPTPVVNKTATWLVELVDYSSTSIPQALVADDSQSRALKLAGKMAVVGIESLDANGKRIPDPFMVRKGYDKLLAEAGGAPAYLFLDDAGNKVYAGRAPTDRKSRDALLAKYMKEVPPPLPDSAKYTVVSRGGELNIVTDGASQYIDEGGHRRLLTAKTNPIKFGALPKYGDHNPIFPSSEWYDLSRANIFGSDDWILDQDGISSCVGNGWAGALRRLRVLAGMKDVKLSPGYAYSLINGNRDQGAVISDGIMALQTHGTCSYATVGEKPFYQSQISAAAKEEAKRYKLGEAFRCNSWEEAVSALLTGRFTLTGGLMVGRTWGKFDQYGVCGHDPGQGNHCVSFDGVKRLADGRIVLDMYNSWSPQFGPFKNGRAYIDKQHLFGGGDQADLCALKIPGRDPQEPFDPPAYKSKSSEDNGGN